MEVNVPDTSGAGLVRIAKASQKQKKMFDWLINQQIEM